MAMIIKEIIRGYNFLFHDIPNPRVEDWFLMSSPWPGLAVLGAYLYFVKVLGPRLMEYRPPFKLDNVIRWYNVFQIAISAYVVYGMYVHGYGKNYSLRCEPMDWSDNYDSVQVAVMAHVYFIVKIIDLLDTVFFVLRKKYNQISFLHVYHHAGMVALAWGGVKWYSNGHAVFIMFINSAVHTVMYSYYLLTSLSDEYKKNLWWKKYITQMQIVQFLWLTVHFTQLVFSNPCNFPAVGLMVIIPQNFFMLCLFLDFYRKAYLKKPVKTS